MGRNPIWEKLVSSGQPRRRTRCDCRKCGHIWYSAADPRGIEHCPKCHGPITVGLTLYRKMHDTLGRRGKPDSHISLSYLWKGGKDMGKMPQHIKDALNDIAKTIRPETREGVRRAQTQVEANKALREGAKKTRARMRQARKEE